MNASRVARLLPLLVLATSCTSLLGVEEGRLDTEGSGGDAQTSSVVASSASSAASTTSTSATASSSTASSAADSSSSSAGGDGGAGAVSSSSSTAETTGVTTSGEGGATSSSTGDGGMGGAPSTASVSSSATSGGDGGAGGEGGVGGAGGEAGEGGEGGGCVLPELPVCPDAQPNPFSGPADINNFWTVLEPEARIASMRLELRIRNGETSARIQADDPLDSPTDCAVWVRLVTPNTNAAVETGLAIASGDGTHSMYFVGGEIRVRDTAGAVAIATPAGAATARIRARFDAAGDLWFDHSGDGACWTNVDGPFAITGPLSPQLFAQRVTSNGNASSIVDDYCR